MCVLLAFIATLQSREGCRNGHVTVNVTAVTVIFILQQRCHLPGRATRVFSEVGEM